MNAHTESATVQNQPRIRNRSLLLDAAVGVLLLGALAISLIADDWQWLMRTGSLVVTAALCAEHGWWKQSAHRAGVIGTITWGWGDLVGALL